MSNFKRYYQDNNVVFITIVTYTRNPILVDNIEIIRDALKEIKYNFKIIAGIVLPDHIHMLIQTDKAENFPKFITLFKVNVSKKLPFNNNQTEEQKQRREKGIWQRKYYDHIIRDEKDFNRHLDYIHFNSMKHLNIIPSEWKYSSFKKFVQLGFYDNNWCNFEDKNDIMSMNEE